MNTIHNTIIDSLQISYARNDGKFRENVLLLGPLPETIRAFEPIWESLATRYNVVAIDLPGFGRSEAHPALYAPKAMSAFVIKAIDHFGLAPAHVVGPDVGASVALFIAQYHPEKIKSAVVGSAACVYPIRAAGILTEMILSPTLDELKKFTSRDIINGALANMSRYSISDEVREDYLSSYDNGRFWDTMQFLKALPRELPDLQLEQIHTPVQIIWGKTDPLAILENGEILRERLPHTEFNILDAGHYVWEDAHEAYAECLIRWLDGGYLSA